MRINRLLSMMLLLQSQGQLTAGELSERLEVSPRTIFRDMETLSAAGIPVVADRGRGGGWSLLEGYRTSLTGLHMDEIQALMLAAPLRVLEDLGLEEASEQAALKLLAALPSVRQVDAERMRERIHIDGTRWYGDDESVTALPLLQDAIWKDRRIEVDYARGDGEVVTRQLDPLGLVVKGRIWYLIASVEDDIRTYRVSRIQHVHITRETFLRPEGFDLATYWERSTREFMASLPQFPLTLRLHRSAMYLIQSWRWATVQSTTPPDDSGWQTAHLLCETLEEATALVLACGARARVIKPADLAQEVRRQAALLSETLNAESES